MPQEPEIFSAISSERDNQAIAGSVNTGVPGWLLRIEARVAKAKDAWQKEGDRGALREILGIASAGVSALEQHGLALDDEDSSSAETAPPPKVEKSPVDEARDAICRQLLLMSWEHGFDCNYPLEPIVEKVRLEVPGVDLSVMHDVDTNTGLLWNLGPYGEGFLSVTMDGKSAGVVREMHEMLAHRCGFRW